MCVCVHNNMQVFVYVGRLDMHECGVCECVGATIVRL